MTYIIAAFYHFFDFPDFAEKQAPLVARMKELSVCGSILIAPEGFNGTMAGSREGLDAMLGELEKLGGPFTHKESESQENPFKRAKVRLKKETISIGEPCPKELVGEYIDAADWNALIADPDTVVLDTRNTYETHIGTFRGAVDPQIRTFKELPGWVRANLGEAKDKKIATFCTGGIRCEKFTAWMRAEGFEKVYHLKGGILKYLEEVPPQQSLWEGECFVFDGRVAVGHGLAPTQTATMCLGCGRALLPEDRDHPSYIEGESCGFCARNMQEKHGVELSLGE